MREALLQFRKEHGLPEDGGVSRKWAKMKFGPIVFPMPNTKGRKRSLLYHDIHHIVTGYKGVLRGETRIGAWEVASGCGDHYSAWMYNLWALALGHFLYPRATYEAFIRGRHSTNLYGSGRAEDELLNSTVESIFESLSLSTKDNRTTVSDGVAFVGWSLVAMVTLLVPPMLIVGVVLILVNIV